MNENTKTRTAEVWEPPLLNIRSSWDKQTFYGKPVETKIETSVLEELLSSGIEEVGENQLTLVNGIRVLPMKKREAKVKKPSEAVRKMPRAKAGAEPTYTINGRGWASKGTMTEGGFVVEAGSTCNHITESFRKEITYYPIRKHLEDEGVIDAQGVFTAAYTFRSAGQAAAVIACSPVSANKAWKTKLEDGCIVTWGELHQRKVGEAKPRWSTRTKHAAKLVPLKGVYEDEYGVKHLTYVSNGTIFEYRGNLANPALLA